MKYLGLLFFIAVIIAFIPRSVTAAACTGNLAGNYGTIRCYDGSNAICDCYSPGCNAPDPSRVSCNTGNNQYIVDDCFACDETDCESNTYPCTQPGTSCNWNASTAFPSAYVPYCPVSGGNTVSQICSNLQISGENQNGPGNATASGNSDPNAAEILDIAPGQILSVKANIYPGYDYISHDYSWGDNIFCKESANFTSSPVKNANNPIYFCDYGNPKVLVDVDTPNTLSDAPPGTVRVKVDKNMSGGISAGVSNPLNTSCHYYGDTYTNYTVNSCNCAFDGETKACDKFGYDKKTLKIYGNAPVNTVYTIYVKAVSKASVVGPKNGCYVKVRIKPEVAPTVTQVPPQTGKITVNLQVRDKPGGIFWTRSMAFNETPNTGNPNTSIYPNYAVSNNTNSTELITCITGRTYSVDLNYRDPADSLTPAVYPAQNNIACGGSVNFLFQGPTPTTAVTAVPPTPTTAASPWIQTHGTSVKVKNAFTNVIPDTYPGCKTFICDISSPSIGSGALTSGGAISLGTGVLASPKDWKAPNYATQTVDVDGFINYFTARKTYKAVTTLDNLEAGAINVFTNTNIVIANAADITKLTNKTPLVILVKDGNITINTNLLTSNAPIIFIVSGDGLSTGRIIFAASVTDAQGIFIANTVNLFGGNKTISITGNLITNSLQGTRNLDNDNIAPYLTITADPNMYMSLLGLVSQSTFEWKELE